MLSPTESVPCVSAPSSAQVSVGTSLLAKKLSYTTEEIRRQTGIDITVSDSAPNGPIARLARHTGIDEQVLTLILKNIREAASGNYIITDAELKTYIKELNRIQQSL